MTARVLHVHRVLLSKVGDWLRLGWREYAREQIASVNEPIVMIEITTERGHEPPKPEMDA